MKKVLTRKELEKIDGGVALGPLIWFKLLHYQKVVRVRIHQDQQLFN